MRRVILVLGIASLPLGAQTQVDLRTQSRNVDFGTAASTRPMKTGAELPATCTTGEMFFKADAAAGSNLYGCVAANTWSLQAGGGGGTGLVTVQSEGVTVGARNTQNFAAGPGLVNALTDTGARVNIQQNVDTAVVQTRAGAQSGATLLCAPASGSSSAYRCSMSPTLTAYTTGMVLYWRPDVTGGGTGVTLDVDTLGAASVKLADGTTDPASGDIIGGELYPVWYDGTGFRLLTPPQGATAKAAARPACSAALRGRVWRTEGGSGVKDEVAVCAKDAAGAFAWRVLY